MAHNTVVGLPGIGNAKTATPRDILMTETGVAYMPTRLLIDGSKSRDPGNTGDVDVLRAGVILGKIEDDSKYAPVILGLLSAQATSTTLTVSAAVATEVVRRFGSAGTQQLLVVSDLNEPGYEEIVVTSEYVTHSAVNTTSGVITVDAMETSDHAAGSFLIAAECTSPPASTTTKLSNCFILAERWGVKVTDDTDANVNVDFRLPLVAGMVNTARIVNYPTNTGLARWLKSELRDGKVGLAFSDEV